MLIIIQYDVSLGFCVPKITKIGSFFIGLFKKVKCHCFFWNTVYKVKLAITVYVPPYGRQFTVTAAVLLLLVYEFCSDCGHHLVSMISIKVNGSLPEQMDQVD